jgi:hypothetical protein
MDDGPYRETDVLGAMLGPMRTLFNHANISQALLRKVSTLISRGTLPIGPAEVSTKIKASPA